jgi:hypothetical protein
VIAHEPEPFDGIAFVSRANQAAAFESISRSSRSWRFLTSQAVELLALRCRHAAVATASIALGLRKPVPDRLRRRLELARQFRRRASGVHQFNHLTPEFSRIALSRSRHRGPLQNKSSGVHQTGATSWLQGRGFKILPLSMRQHIRCFGTSAQPTKHSARCRKRPTEPLLVHAALAAA